MRKSPAGAILIAGLVLIAAWVGFDVLRTAVLTEDAPRTVSPRGTLSEMEQSVIALFQQVAPSVAFIITDTGQDAVGPGGQNQFGTGSGFVWDRAGHIVTNHHVVEGARGVAVRFESEKLYRATVVGSAPDYDLAVIRLTDGHRDVQPIAIGSSKDLKVGQAAFAIGNPFGLNRTLTTGIISALDRSLPTNTNREIRGVIQTDAAINPGNSGGPLLDSAGRLIGVNTAILSESGASAGIGFAVPVDVVNRVVPQLIRNGRVPRPGIGIVAMAPEQTAALDIPGIAVAQVQPGSPAAKAGLRGIDVAARRMGDVITHVNGKRVHSVPDMADILTEVGVGNRATLTVVREGAQREVEISVVDISP